MITQKTLRENLGFGHDVKVSVHGQVTPGILLKFN